MGTMKLICTYCAGAKRDDEGLLPAVDRYRSERIRGLFEQARGENLDFRILSGIFGLLAPEQPIPWYDHLLEPQEVANLATRVAAALAALEAHAVEYHTADPRIFPDVAPYHEVMDAACRIVNLKMEVIVLAGNPE